VYNGMGNYTLAPNDTIGHEGLYTFCLGQV
jgi:hypothetical protein